MKNKVKQLLTKLKKNKTYDKVMPLVDESNTPLSAFNIKEYLNDPNPQLSQHRLNKIVNFLTYLENHLYLGHLQDDFKMFNEGEDNFFTYLANNDQKGMQKKLKEFFEFLDDWTDNEFIGLKQFVYSVFEYIDFAVKIEKSHPHDIFYKPLGRLSSENIKVLSHVSGLNFEKNKSLKQEDKDTLTSCIQVDVNEETDNWFKLYETYGLFTSMVTGSTHVVKNYMEKLEETGETDKMPEESLKNISHRLTILEYPYGLNLFMYCQRLFRYFTDVGAYRDKLQSEKLFREFDKCITIPNLSPELVNRLQEIKQNLQFVVDKLLTIEPKVEHQWDIQEVIKNKAPMDRKLAARLTRYIFILSRFYYVDEDYHIALEESYPVGRIVSGDVGDDELLTMVYQDDLAKVYPFVQQWLDKFNQAPYLNEVKSQLLRVCFSTNNVIQYNEKSQQWEWKEDPSEESTVYTAVHASRYGLFQVLAMNTILKGCYPQMMEQLEPMGFGEQTNIVDYLIEVTEVLINHNQSLLPHPDIKLAMVCELLTLYSLGARNFTQRIEAENLWNDETYFTKEHYRKFVDWDVKEKYAVSLPFSQSYLIVLTNLFIFTLADESDDKREEAANMLNQLTRHWVMMKNISLNQRRGYQYLDKVTQAVLKDDITILAKEDNLDKRIKMAF